MRAVLRADARFRRVFIHRFYEALGGRCVCGDSIHLVDWKPPSSVESSRAGHHRGA